MDSFENRAGEIWLDGEMVPWAEAKAHVLSHSLHFASAVFEGIRVYDGVAYKLEQHIERFAKSAGIVDFEIPFTLDEISNACQKVISRQSLVEGYLRPIAWRGAEFMSPHAIGASVHVAVAGWEWPVYYSPESRMEGIRLTVTKWRRPAPSMAPVLAKASGLYQICTLAKHESARAGFDDALMFDYREFVAETTSSNIFFVVDDEVLTPIADCFLDGITRQTVLDLARADGMTVRERHLEADVLQRAKEVFITGTAAEVTPVRAIDEITYQPGDVTMRLLQLYDAEVRPRTAT
jgi:branched-chain amino acid aminotransferase